MTQQPSNNSGPKFQELAMLSRLKASIKDKTFKLVKNFLNLKPQTGEVLKYMGSIFGAGAGLYKIHGHLIYFQMQRMDSYFFPGISQPFKYIFTPVQNVFL